ncbi:MAG: hypothetical protein V3V06_07225, partial [Dehalococcoidia bacterium]
PGVANGDTVSVSYTAASAGGTPIEDATGNAAADLAVQAVTNQSGGGGGAPPDSDSTPDGDDTDPLHPAQPGDEQPLPEEELLIDETLLIADAGEDGSLVATSADGTVSVMMPVNGLPDTEGVHLTVAVIDEEAMIATPPPPGMLLIGGQAYLIEAFDDQNHPITNFLEALTISIQLDLEAVDRESVGVFFYDTGLGHLVRIPATIAADGTITFLVDHLTLFAPLQLPTIVRTLGSNWNAVTFTGPSGTPPAELAAQLGPFVDSIWRWDAATQTWESYFVGAPSVVSKLQTLNEGEALFVRMAVGASVDFTTTDLIVDPSGARTVTLLPGWNLLSFNGPDGTRVASLLSEVTDAATVYLFDSVTQSWLGFFPGQPAFLNGFTVVNRLDAIFIFNPSDGSLELTLPEVPAGGGALDPRLAKQTPSLSGGGR